MLCLQDTAWHLSDMLSCTLSVLLYKPKKACQKLQQSRACLLSRKTHYRLILSPQCPASLNAEHTSSWHVASMPSSLPFANSNHFTMTVDGYSLSLAGINPQIARLLQNWPWCNIASAAAEAFCLWSINRRWVLFRRHSCCNLEAIPSLAHTSYVGVWQYYVAGLWYAKWKGKCFSGKGVRLFQGERVGHWNTS